MALRGPDSSNRRSSARLSSCRRFGTTDFGGTRRALLTPAAPGCTSAGSWCVARTEVACRPWSAGTLAVRGETRCPASVGRHHRPAPTDRGVPPRRRRKLATHRPRAPGVRSRLSGGPAERTQPPSPPPRESMVAGWRRRAGAPFVPKVPPARPPGCAALRLSRGEVAPPHAHRDDLLVWIRGPSRLPLTGCQAPRKMTPARH